MDGFVIANEDEFALLEMPAPRLITTEAQWLNMNTEDIQIELDGVVTPRSQEVKEIVLSDSDKKRFEAKIKRGEKPVDCWLWTAGKFDSGYGCFSVSPPKRQYRAHRVSYRIYKGEIPHDLKVLHNCPTGDNPACVNPSHLWLGSYADNMKDREKKGRGRRLHGTDSPCAKLTVIAVLKIRQLYRSGLWQQQEIAEMFNTTKTTICNVVHYKIYKNIT